MGNNRKSYEFSKINYLYLLLFQNNINCLLLIGVFIGGSLFVLVQTKVMLNIYLYNFTSNIIVVILPFPWKNVVFVLEVFVIYIILCHFIIIIFTVHCTIFHVVYICFKSLYDIFYVNH